MTDRTQEPKRVALQGLILLALHRAGNTIRSGTGNVPTELRERIGIPDNPNNRNYISKVLNEMDKSNLILRDTRSKRTFEVSIDPLTDKQVKELEEREVANKLPFGSVSVEEKSVSNEADTDASSDETLDKLVSDCHRAFEMIKQVAARAEDVTSGGLVAISVGSTLRSIGITNQRGGEIKYYLRQLGLAKSIRRSERTDKWWYWQVASDKQLDEAKLRSMAIGDQSYLHHQVRQGRAVFVEDTPKERRFAGKTPAVLPAELCSRVTTRRVGDEMSPDDEKTPPPQPEVTETASHPEEAPSVNPESAALDLEAIVRVIRRLEAENVELREELANRDGDVERLQTAKDQADQQVVELTEQLRTRDERLGALTATSTELSALVARYS